MRARRLVWKSAVLLGALAVSPVAFGADMPRADYPSVGVAPLPVMYDWTGVYMGVNAGYGWGDFRARSGTASFSDGFEFDGELFEGSFVFPGASLDADGWLAGGQLGANWQRDQFVFGLEADLQWSGMDSNTNVWTGQVADFATLDAPDFSEFDVATKAELPWFGTVRGRVGFAFERFLVYGTGGLAYGRGKATMSVTAYELGTGDNMGTVAASDRQGHLGWTLGAGMEAAVTDNLSLKAEYLYVDLGSKTYRFAFADGGGNSASAHRKIDFDAHIVRVGLNWRFHSGGL